MLFCLRRNKYLIEIFLFLFSINTDLRMSDVVFLKKKDIATLMMISGHSSEAVTKRYICINDDDISTSLHDFKLVF